MPAKKSKQGKPRARSNSGTRRATVVRRKPAVRSRSKASTRSAASDALSVASLASLRNLGGASNTAIVAVPSRDEGLRSVATRLHMQLSGSITQWELMLLEHLLSPLRPYPLPGVSNPSFSQNNAYAPFPINTGSVEPACPVSYAWLNCDPGAFDGSGNPGTWAFARDTDGAATPYRVNNAITDCHVGCRYDQREGLIRGTFSVVESGAYLIWFDVTDSEFPVVCLGLNSTEECWTDIGNTKAVFSGANSQLLYSWDRDPFRGYEGEWLSPNPVNTDFQSDASTLIYPGGATLHLAVQAKTAYSDIAIKARSFERYDRRFFDAPTRNGEYGDPSQPMEAREALAVYSGSCWRQRTRILSDASAELRRARLVHIIQSGMPLLEVHVVNATTGGAPVNFNFEARAWIGMTYHGLRDAATSPYHTVPAVMPPWFATMRTRGVVSKTRSGLSDELIANTATALASTPAKSAAVSAVTNAVVSNAKPSGFKGFVNDVLSEVGIDPANPLSSIAKLAGRKLVPLLGRLF